MYPKYTTDAFVLGSVPSGEADRLVSFYTRDFGLVKAVSKSVRLQKSKLKAHLEEGNFLAVSLIKGKEIWRLTDAERKEEISFPSGEFDVFIKIIRLLKSLVQGEEPHPDLFDLVLESRRVLNNNLSKEELSSLECLIVVRILDSLGYGRQEKDWGISVSEPICKELLSEVYSKKDKLVTLINNSLKESHL